MFIPALLINYRSIPMALRLVMAVFWPVWLLIDLVDNWASTIERQEKESRGEL